jgi:hypothetical protein
LGFLARRKKSDVEFFLKKLLTYKRDQIKLSEQNLVRAA